MDHGELIKDMKVTEQPFFSEGNVIPVTVYSFKVGKHGPFTLTFRHGEDTPEKVNAAIQARVTMLRDTGALRADER